MINNDTEFISKFVQCGDLAETPDYIVTRNTVLEITMFNFNNYSNTVAKRVSFS